MCVIYFDEHCCLGDNQFMDYVCICVKSSMLYCCYYLRMSQLLLFLHVGMEALLDWFIHFRVYIKEGLAQLLFNSGQLLFIRVYYIAYS